MASLTDDQAVRKVQQWLRDMGFSFSAVDGDWGPLSEYAWQEALKHFQPPAKPAEPPTRADGGLRRIIGHWTAGSYIVGDAVKHYHFIIDKDGRVVAGNLRPEDNISTADGIYTPHTLNANTGAIGIAIAAMAGAQESPFRWGTAPILPVQMQAYHGLAARLARQYGIPIERRTVLTHAEVEPTLGIPQRGKWDIRVLPGMTSPGKAVEVGDRIRSSILAAA